MSMYCGGHGHTLPCPECAQNLRNRLAREAAGSDVDQIITAIRALPLSVGRLKSLICAVEVYSQEMSLHGDTHDVSESLLDALRFADRVRVYEREEA